MSIRKKALIIIAAGLIVATLAGFRGSLSGGATGVALVVVGTALLGSPAAASKEAE